MCIEITYSFPNFNGAIVEVWEWISTFITHFTGYVITDPCWNWSQSLLMKGIPLWGLGVFLLLLTHLPLYIAAKMRRWIGSTLIQVMACRIFGAKPLPEPMWTLRNTLQRISNQNAKLFIHENAFANVVGEMAAILSRGRWVNPDKQSICLLFKNAWQESKRKKKTESLFIISYVISYSVIYCIYIPGKPGILFSWVQLVGYVLVCRSYSFVCTLHHLIIIIVQTYPKTLNLILLYHISL